MKKISLLLRTVSPFLLLSLQSGIWIFVWISYYAALVPTPFYWKGQLLLTVLYFIILLAISNFYGGFRVGYYRATEVALSKMISLVFANIIAYIQASLIITAIVSPLPIIMMTVLQCLIAFIWAFSTNRIYQRNTSPHRMIMIFDGDAPVDELIQKLHTRADKYKIEEALHVADVDFDTICSHVKGFDAVVFRGISPQLHSDLQRFCFINSIRTYTVPDIKDILTQNAEEINLFDTPLFLNRNDDLSNNQRSVKRMMDIAVSVFALTILLPFSLICALAIKLCDRGPIIYSQERLTFGGKRFMLHKFRSMTVSAESNGAQLSPVNDKRVTPVGRVMRSLRLDEIPQFYNVLRGDMSIVGPRPERPEIVAEYEKSIPDFAYRLKVKAGITGYAQVYGNYNTDPRDKLLMDLLYISSFSVMMDLKIILMTIKILLQRERTMGVRG